MFKRHSKKIVLVLLVLGTLELLYLHYSTGLGSRIKYKPRGHGTIKPPIREKTLRTRVPKHEQTSADDFDIDQNGRYTKSRIKYKFRGQSGLMPSNQENNMSTSVVHKHKQTFTGDLGRDLEQNGRYTTTQGLSSETRSDKTEYDKKKSVHDDRKHSPRNINTDTNSVKTTSVQYRHSNTNMITYNDIVFPEPDCNRKFLFYVCSTGDECGGLADRQKGMMSAFLLAILTGRTFQILNNYPCDIKQYVQPNLYDWTKCWTHMNKYVNYTQLEIQTYRLGFGMEFTFPKDLARYHGDDLWDEHVVKVHLNNRFLQLMKSNRFVRNKMSWIAQVPEERIIKNVMEILFKNSNHLQQQVSMFFRRHVQGRPLVCGHIRMGQNPSFKGPYRDQEFMNNTNAVKLLKTIREIHRLTPDSVLFLSSDSNDLKLIAKEIIKNITLFNGQIEHIDKIRSETCSGTNTAFLEQQILSKCDTLVMTGSGFSRMAAYMGGKATHIYTTESRRSTDIKEVTFRDLPYIFGQFD